MTRRSEEWLAEYSKRNVERVQLARAWNGNTAKTVIKPVTPKFRNVKTDGYASKRERDRAFALRLMQEAGQIRGLREQVEYELIPKQDGERACKYRADFVYEEFATDSWREVVEDTKGHRTPDYIIKRKLMLFRHGIKVRET